MHNFVNLHNNRHSMSAEALTSCQFLALALDDQTWNLQMVTVFNNYKTFALESITVYSYT